MFTRFQLNQIGDVANMADQNMEKKILIQSTILSSIFIIGLFIHQSLPMVLGERLAFLGIYFWLLLWSINIVVYFVFNKYEIIALIYCEFCMVDQNLIVGTYVGSSWQS